MCRFSFLTMNSQSKIQRSKIEKNNVPLPAGAERTLLG